MSSDHSHSHHHQLANYNRAFAIGVALNVVFVIIEASYGVLADSLALIADAGHNLSDVVSLLLAWGASVLASRPATKNRTYGFRKATVLVSLSSAILLLFALGAIAWEAIDRFLDPQPVAGATIIVVAAIGVVVNTLTALLFVRGQKNDLNIRGAFLHMAADAGVSLGVVISGALIMLTGWLWIDPAISLLIVVVVFVSTWGLLRDSTNYALDSVPKGIDSAKIREFFQSIEKVRSIHDLHIWSLSTTESALTVHLVVDDCSLDNEFLADIQKRLNKQFGIAHSTIQVEATFEANPCMLKEVC